MQSWTFGTAGVLMAIAALAMALLGPGRQPESGVMPEVVVIGRGPNQVVDEVIVRPLSVTAMAAPDAAAGSATARVRSAVN